MAQNVTIAGASYLGVPRIEMPKTGGGTAVFVDTSDANAAAGDITKGKTAYVGGTKITGTLEASSVSVQDTKALTITSNGTVSVTPDAPYDALKKVDVTVDVASVSTVTINCADNSTFAFWLSPSGEFFHNRLNSSANTIIVTQYSPIGLYNMNHLKPEDWNNIGLSESYLPIADEGSLDPRYYNICFATDITASITFPSG